MTVNRAPKVFAHRGASQVHEGNTIPAFVAAGQIGADGVELDVRPSADGCLIVHHDPTLADGGRKISTMAAGELPDGVPTLAAVLDVCDDMIVNIEIKTDPGDDSYDQLGTFAQRLVELIQQRDLGHRALVSSFDRAMLRTVHLLDPSIPTGLLSRVEEDAIAEAVEGGHIAVHPGTHLVHDRYIALAHERGLFVNVWTVDDPGRMRQLAALGVDGIVTNVPDVAMEVLRK